MRFGTDGNDASVAAMTPLEPNLSPRRVTDTDSATALFAGLAGEAAEVAAFAYLSEDRSLLGLRHARVGSIDRLELPFRDILADVLALDPAALLMAHNHPSGDATPSMADREATRMLARMLDPLGIRLLDHLVIATGGTTSFRALGLL
ncbi:MAG: JAB domain-containing protein [Sphingomonas sp.]